MAQLLLDFGASKSKLHSGIVLPHRPLTAFQAVFWGSSKGVQDIAQGPIDYDNRQELARVFLDNGQDPDVDVFCHEIPHLMSEDPFKKLQQPSRCKPLHTANYKLSKMLLRRHANVNGLDNLDQTPLDVALLSFQVLGRSLFGYTGADL